MNNRKFKLIKGGLSSPEESDKKTFVSAYLTNTRLMGVIGLYIHWEMETSNLLSDLHQFFYFDAEEYGFETYKSIAGNDASEIEFMEKALMGGLAGEKIDITQKEAIYLIQFYADMNLRSSIPLPEGEREYEFLIEHKVELSPREEEDLFIKQCISLKTPYQVINYFLMRYFGRDFKAAAFLTNGKVPLDIFSDVPPATLCKNSIDPFSDADGNSFLCESLIEHDTSYMLIISEIKISNMRVSSFEKRSAMLISAAEAAMMLSRPEFVTVYEVLSFPDELNVDFSEMTESSLMTAHENGKLYMTFNKNNDHVNSRVFRLNEDVFGLYYITDFGQLIIAAYSIKGIHAMERELRRSTFSQSLMPVSKYEFKEPVLYEFIQSGFEEFEEFLDYIKG